MQSESSENAPQNARHLVITVHGIRTYGDWQERFEVLAVDAIGRTQIEFDNYKYGFSSSIAFIFPFSRWWQVRRFKKYLLPAIAREEWASVSLFGHSFGTHLIAWALLRTPSELRPRISTIALTGTVLKQTFPWSRLSGCFERLVNDCGAQDSILILNQFLVLGTGMAGREGFVGGNHSKFRNRFHVFGHSGYFSDSSGARDNKWMERFWLPLLTSEAPFEPYDDRPSVGIFEGFLSVVARYVDPIKLTVLVSPFVLAFLFVLGLYLNAEHEARTAAGRELAARALQIEQAPNEVNGYYDRAVLLAASAEVVAQFPDTKWKQTLYLIREGLGKEGLALRAGNALKWLGDFETKKNLSVKGDVLRVLRSSLSALPYKTGQSRFGSRYIFDVAFSDDGQRLLGVGVDGAVWAKQTTDPNSFERWFQADTRPLRAFAFNIDGKLFATAGESNTVRLWDAKTGSPIGEPMVEVADPELGAGINAVAFDPHGRWLATASDYSTVTVWDLKTFKQLRLPIRQHQGEVYSVAFNSDGSLLASGGSDGILRIWRTDNWHIDTSLPNETSGQNGIFAVGFIPGGNGLAYGAGDGKLRFFGLDENSILGAPSRVQHGGAVTSIGFSKLGTMLASGGNDGSVLVWDFTNLSRGPKRFEVGVAEEITGIAIAPNELTLVTARKDGFSGNLIEFWDVRRRVRVGGKAHSIAEDSLRSGSFSPDGRLVIWGNWSGEKVGYLEEITDADVVDKELSAPNVTEVRIDGKNRFLLATDFSGSVWSFDLRAPSTEWQRIGNHGTGELGLMGAWSLRFRPQTDEFATAGTDNLVQYWNPSSATEARTPLNPFDVLTTAIAFSTDGRLLAAGSEKGAVRVFTVRDGKVLFESQRTDREKEVSIGGLLFSQDGKWLIETDTDGQISVREMKTGLLLGRPFLAHAATGSDEAISSLALSDDGRLLATGSGDGSIRLWDVETQLSVGPALVGHTGRINALRFSSDGNTLSSLDEGGSVWDWHIDLGVVACSQAGRNLRIEEYEKYPSLALGKVVCSEQDASRMITTRDDPSPRIAVDPTGG